MPTYKAYVSGLSGGATPDGTELVAGIQAGEDFNFTFVQIGKTLVPAITATASGTDTYAATLSPAITAYTTGLLVVITFTNANTGSSTLNLNTLGAVTLKKSGTTNLSAGDISAGQSLLLRYDGTNFQVIGGGGAATWGSITGTLSSQTDLLAALYDIKNKQGFSSLYAL